MDKKRGFTAIKDSSGKVRALVDAATVDFFESKAPHPSQTMLDELLSNVDQIQVVALEAIPGKPLTYQQLLDTSDSGSVATLRRALTIVEDPATFGHCMCLGDPHLKLFSRGQLIASIGYHHGVAIRWDSWKFDAVLKEPSQLLDWMSAHGVLGPQREHDANLRDLAEAQRRVELWLAATPECLRPMWEDMKHVVSENPELERQLMTLLATAWPSLDSQVGELFRWFGSGSGRWSGHPSYESIPERLLLSLDLSQLIRVASRPDISDAELRGAARFFGGYHFRKLKGRATGVLDAPLRTRLLEAVRQHGLPDNISRAEVAFGKP